ncbi:MAG: hypothetical protein WED07_16530 [Candidatus Freyarchaeum deiterrae]
MVYVDKPKPSKGYLIYFILGCLVFPPALLMLTIILTIEFTNPIFPNPPLILLVDFSFYVVLSIIFFGIMVHAMYNTEYRIENGKLWLKFGSARKESVSLDEIRGIEKVEFIRGNWQLRFHNKSYCNRFKNGIRIITEKSTYWVSPEDNERFVSKLGLKISS